MLLGMILFWDNISLIILVIGIVWEIHWCFVVGLWIEIYRLRMSWD